jgi:molybdopterin converting factor small subunit
MIRVFIPSQLHAYSGGASRTEAEGGTVGAVLDDLDGRFPGLKFRVIDEQDRIRPHMRIFANGEPVRSLGLGLSAGDEVMIFGALSGG